VGGTDVTDGWNARSAPPPAGSTLPANGTPAPGSPWWSDALADPWRDPYAPAKVVLPSAPDGSAPAPEKVADPDAPRRSLTPVLLICLVTALLAGGLGGTLGYVFAVRGGLATGRATQLGGEAARGLQDRVLLGVRLGVLQRLGRRRAERAG
jgi:putative serine protease PepD